VGVDNGFADTENHRFETPFAVSRVTRRAAVGPPRPLAYAQVRASVGRIAPT
jgi:hypothetical protein